MFDSLVINKSAVFQNDFILEITKYKCCASFSCPDIAIKNAVPDNNISGNRTSGCIGSRSISAIDVNCPANASIYAVAGECRVFDRHAAQQVINSTAEAAFVVGKFAIFDSQSTPAFSGNRAATAFGSSRSRTIIATKQAVNYSRRAAETRENAATHTGNIILDLAII